jgi:ATP-dependent protease ClpP protease subunit
MKAYLKAMVKNTGRSRAGLGIELFRLDVAPAPELTEEEDEALATDADGDSNGTAIMRIYEEIGEDFWTGAGVTAKAFAEELDAFGEIKRLHLHINCLGGDAFTAQAIHSLIQQHKAGSKNAYIDGVCASAATLVACGANRVVARYNTSYMVHYPWGICMGDAEEMRKAAENLDAVTKPIVKVYQKKVGAKLNEEEIRQLMADETWMTADEALEKGFVDSVRGNGKGIVRVGAGRIMCSGRLMDLARYHYRNMPKWPSKRLPLTATDPLASSACLSWPTTTPLAEFKPEAAAQARPKEPEKKGKNMTKEEIAPELLASIEAEARSVERARLEALDAMAGPGLQDIIAKAKTEGRQPGDIALECLAVTKQQLSASEATSALARDAAAARAVPAGDAPAGTKPEAKAEAKGVRFMVNAFKSQKPRGLAHAGRNGRNGNN